MLKLDKKFHVDKLANIKKRPLELALFAIYISEDLKKQRSLINELSISGMLMFLIREEIMVKGKNGKYI